jgi:hypothetical protein
VKQRVLWWATELPWPSGFGGGGQPTLKLISLESYNKYNHYGYLPVWTFFSAGEGLVYQGPHVLVAIVGETWPMIHRVRSWSMYCHRTNSKDLSERGILQLKQEALSSPEMYIVENNEGDLFVNIVMCNVYRK